MPGYVNIFSRELGGGKEAALQKLLPMRNLLAHGGRISDEMVTQLLYAHAERFEQLMSGLTFLSEDAGIHLVALPAEGTARLLRGLAASDEPYNRSQLPTSFQQSHQERMLLVTPDGVLDLFPLRAYGEVFHIEKEQLQSRGEETLQIYSRREATGVDYTTLGGRESYSRHPPASSSPDRRRLYRRNRPARLLSGNRLNTLNLRQRYRVNILLIHKPAPAEHKNLSSTCNGCRQSMRGATFISSSQNILDNASMCRQYVSTAFFVKSTLRI